MGKIMMIDGLMDERAWRNVFSDYGEIRRRVCASKELHLKERFETGGSISTALSRTAH